jgi:DNA-binding transcriptional regulator YiaG
VRTPTTRIKPDEVTLEDMHVHGVNAALHLVRHWTANVDQIIPNWKAASALDLIAAGLDSLRHFLEDPEEREVSWDSPFIELHYAVRWDFGAVERGEDPMAIVSTAFSAEDVVDGAVPQEKVFDVIGSHVRTRLLQDLTAGIVEWRARGNIKPEGRPSYLVPKSVQAYLDEATGATLDESGVNAPEVRGTPEAVAHRARLVDELARPFGIGTEEIDLDALGRKDEIPPDVAARFGRSLPGLPSLEVPINLPGRPRFSVLPFLLVYPLRIHADEHRAFFPVVLGLSIHPSSASPQNWPNHERAAFWTALVDAIKAKADKAADGRRMPRRRWVTPETSPTSTLLTPETVGLMRAETEPEVHPAPREAVEAFFPLAFRRTIMDNDVAAMLGRLQDVRLPVKRWATLPTLADLEEQEVRRLQDELGDEAERRTADRGALLLKRTRKGETVYSLSSEAVHALKVRHGLGLGYRDLDPKTGEEFLVRLFQANRGYLEVGLSWERMAGPWVEEWRKNLEAAADREEENRRASLFESIDEEHRQKVDRLLLRVKRLGDGWKVLELILSELMASGANPVRLPAVVLKTLLKCETDTHARARIDSALESLRAVTVRVKSFGMESIKAYGSLVSWWEYHGAGAGSHGDGDYVVRVTPEAVGCLKVFESGTHRLASGREVTNYAFGKPDEDQKKGLKGVGFVGFDSGRVFYNAAEDFKPEEEALVAFLEKELTTNRAAARDCPKGRKAIKRPPNAADANEARIYTSDFCPLLEDGRRYHAALSNFTPNPEAGITLAGSRTRPTKSGGAHSEGLLGRMGFLTPPGKVSAERTRQIRLALEAMKSVVVDYLEGVVAGNDEGGKWLSLNDAAALPENELKRVRWYFFLPETWATIRRQKWNARQAERARKGLATYAWKATSDPRTAEAASLALRGQAVEVRQSTAAGEASGLVLVRHRLRKARLERGLTHEAVGKAFGVGRTAVQKWERGTDPDEDGKVRGMPIPVGLVPLVLRWVETGKEPTAAELAAARKS